MNYKIALIKGDGIGRGGVGGYVAGAAGPMDRPKGGGVGPGQGPGGVGELAGPGGFPLPLPFFFFLFFY